MFVVLHVAHQLLQLVEHCRPVGNALVRRGRGQLMEGGCRRSRARRIR